MTRSVILPLFRKKRCGPSIKYGWSSGLAGIGADKLYWSLLSWLS